MAAKYWIKLYHEILHDPKMGRLDDRLWRRFIELCLIAGENDADGVLPPVGDMAWTLRLDDNDLAADLAALSDIGLVVVDPDRVTWAVTNFAKRQAPVPGSERVARYRERQRTDQYYGNDSLQDNDTIRYTEPDTDTDTDKTEGADAPGNGPTTFAEWQELIRDSKNRPADLVGMYSKLYPGRDPPAFGYMGKIAREVGGAGRMAELLWQHSTRPPTGDVLSYVRQVAKGGSKRARHSDSDQIVLQGGYIPHAADPSEFEDAPG